jgi:hypothetical protein
MSQPFVAAALDHAKTACQLPALASQVVQILGAYRVNVYGAVQSGRTATILGNRATCADRTRIYSEFGNINIQVGNSRLG